MITRQCSEIKRKIWKDLRFSMKMVFAAGFRIPVSLSDLLQPYVLQSEAPAAEEFSED